ncbi:hypothetical protein V5T82_17665 [Magnetovibrio sp. PR-2]|uniref:hypothetical protein n=1 Tax=Magnetovibrio sp. PR-2 TaxID=3120356 RepID=UPI002FCE2192
MANTPKGANPKAPTGRAQRKTAGKKAATRPQAKKAASQKPAAKPQNEPDWNDEFDDLLGFDSLEDGPVMDPEFEAYMKAAAQRYMAHRQAGSGQQSSKPRKQRAQAEPPTGGSGSGQVAGGDDYLNMLTRILEDMGSGEAYPGQHEEMAGGVNMILGSGPAFATLNTMMTNSSAQGSVLLNATQMQRQLDQVGLVCTSACVKQLLNMNQSTGDGE